MLQNEAMAEFLKAEIAQKGPMDIATFMDHILAHPEMGYYRRQDPFGERGDFMTSPEISQLFGEMIGVWAADIWRQMGKPSPFAFVEVGPGRGTLMADMMRACKGVDGFHDAARIFMIETSPVLRRKQEKTLKGHKAQWFERFEDVPQDMPIILIGNEFLDALPVHQLVKMGDGWRERMIVLAQGVPKTIGGMQGALQALAPNLLGGGPEGNLDFRYDTKEAAAEFLALVPDGLPQVPDGNIFEVSPQRDEFVRLASRRIRENGGAALFIDYGSAESVIGSGLHAIFRHAHVDVLKNPGHADISSNVDFGAVRRVGEAEGMKISGGITQGEFLKALGIEMRAEMLSKKASAKQKEDLQSGLYKLVEMDQMGDFIVMGLSYGPDIIPAGF